MLKQVHSELEAIPRAERPVKEIAALRRACRANDVAAACAVVRDRGSAYPWLSHMLLQGVVTTVELLDALAAVISSSGGVVGRSKTMLLAAACRSPVEVVRRVMALAPSEPRAALKAAVRAGRIDVVRLLLTELKEYVVV